MPQGQPARSPRRRYATRGTVKWCPLGQCEHPFWDHVVVTTTWGGTAVCEKCECNGRFVNVAA